MDGVRKGLQGAVGLEEGVGEGGGGGRVVLGAVDDGDGLGGVEDAALTGDGDSGYDVVSGE